MILGETQAEAAVVRPVPVAVALAQLLWLR
jgi:hypothetical protein